MKKNIQKLSPLYITLVVLGACGGGKHDKLSSSEKDQVESFSNSMSDFSSSLKSAVSTLKAQQTSSLSSALTAVTSGGFGHSLSPFALVSNFGAASSGSRDLSDMIDSSKCQITVTGDKNAATATVDLSDVSSMNEIKNSVSVAIGGSECPISYSVTANASREGNSRVDVAMTQKFEALTAEAKDALDITSVDWVATMSVSNLTDESGNISLKVTGPVQSKKHGHVNTDVSADMTVVNESTTIDMKATFSFPKFTAVLEAKGNTSSGIVTKMNGETVH